MSLAEAMLFTSSSESMALTDPFKVRGVAGSWSSSAEGLSARVTDAGGLADRVTEAAGDCWRGWTFWTLSGWDVSASESE